MLWVLALGDSSMSNMLSSSHNAWVLSYGTHAGSGDRIAKNEKSRVLGSKGLCGAS